jgi:hypothetical protein
VLPEHWMRAAKLVGFNEELAVAHVRDLIARVPGMALAVRYDLSNLQSGLQTVDQIVDAIWKRTVVLARTYGSELMSPSAGE